MTEGATKEEKLLGTFLGLESRREVLTRLLRMQAWESSE